MKSTYLILVTSTKIEGDTSNSLESLKTFCAAGQRGEKYQVTNSKYSCFFQDLNWISLKSGYAIFGAIV